MTAHPSTDPTPTFAKALVVALGVFLGTVGPLLILDALEVAEAPQWLADRFPVDHHPGQQDTGAPADDDPRNCADPLTCSEVK